ncbi:general substrate transporter [Thelonectria olida]|uniref:General substrate transporter n=1 Tax=Thelonectria olida TaxID=1576542 RepID=A0A9P9AI13_9HYPO|nr:general substrate transporter [Thelonectria olida]
MAVSTGAAATTTAWAKDALPWWKDRGLRKLVLWQMCILFSQFLVGYDEVIVGSFQAMQPWKQAMGNPSSSDVGLITSITFVGGFAGALVAAVPADRFGRRPAMALGIGMEIIGSILQAAAPSRGIFIAGRFVLGCGLSFTTTAGPSLLNELAHPRLRGRIAAAFNVLWYLGSILASWLTFGTGHLTTNWSWRIPSIVQSVAPSLLFVAILFIPESPRWLYSKGRVAEAQALLVKYHGNGDEGAAIVVLELQEIDEALTREREEQIDSWRNVLRSRANRKRFGIVISVSVLTLWNGQGAITYYFSPILTSVGITTTNQQTGINGGMSIWNFLCSALGAYLVDRIGRRPLWLASFIGLILANIPLIVSNAMYVDHGSKSAAYAVVVFMFFYNAAFNIACNPLLYCYTPEILPYSIRTRGLALQILVSQAALTVNQYVNPIALDSIGYWLFVFYLGVCIMGLAIIWFTFPETKGYNLEELGALFDDDNTVLKLQERSILHGKDPEAGHTGDMEIVKAVDCKARG